MTQQCGFPRSQKATQQRHRQLAPALRTEHLLALLLKPLCFFLHLCLGTWPALAVHLLARVHVTQLEAKCLEHVVHLVVRLNITLTARENVDVDVLNGLTSRGTVLHGNGKRVAAVSALNDATDTLDSLKEGAELMSRNISKALVRRAWNHKDMPRHDRLEVDYGNRVLRLVKGLVGDVEPAKVNSLVPGRFGARGGRSAADGVSSSCGCHRCEVSRSGLSVTPFICY